MQERSLEEDLQVLRELERRLRETPRDSLEHERLDEEVRRVQRRIWGEREKDPQPAS